MKSHNFKKKFGQNFLTSSKFVTKLLEPLDISPGDTLIEIGPGDGAVTSKILSSGARVIAIEIDYDCIVKLVKRFGDSQNFKLINEDILKLNIPTFLKDLNIKSDFKVVGSLPYNISKKIIDKFLMFSQNSSDVKVKVMSFIVQEEVASAYSARAPQATFLSNYIRVFAKVKKYESIPATLFFPRPKVNGGILTITPYTHVIENKLTLVQLLRVSFSSPRKTLKRNLLNAKLFDKNSIEKTFQDLGLKETIRPAEIEFEKWEEILKNLKVVKLET